jgi:hypothetical protein
MLILGVMNEICNNLQYLFAVIKLAFCGVWLDFLLFKILIILCLSSHTIYFKQGYFIHTDH